MRLLVLALAALSLAGCETTQEKSARLEKTAHSRRAVAAAQGLRITSPSRSVKVSSATVLHGSEGTAVAVTLANRGAAQREVPLEISVSQSGAAPYSNAAAGLARSLTSAAYVPAHGTTVWVDDQIQLSGAPGAVTPTVGEGRGASAAAPKLTIGAHHLETEAGGEVLSGSVANGSTVAQRELAVYAVASRAGHAVAAGRAVIPALAAGASSRFQIFLIGGSARGARLTLIAPPSSF